MRPNIQPVANPVRESIGMGEEGRGDAVKSGS